MRRTSIAVSLLLAIGLSVSCNREKDAVLPDGRVEASQGGKDVVLDDGTKLFGDLELKDGSEKIQRIEYSSGEKRFNITRFKNFSQTIDRIEYPNGERIFEATVPAPSKRGFDVEGVDMEAKRVELPSGEKWFDVTWLSDHSIKIGHAVLASGEERYSITWISDEDYANAVLWTLNFTDVQERCGRPISKKVGVDTSLLYRVAGGHSYLLWFGWDMPDEGKVTHRDVTYFREGDVFVNNRFKRLRPIELTKAMPCLLKGGKASIQN